MQQVSDHQDDTRQTPFWATLPWAEVAIVLFFAASVFGVIQALIQRCR